MAETYYTILTDIGLAKFTNAYITQDKVNLTEIAAGDSNGSYYNPTSSQTALNKEVWRGPISLVKIDSNNPNWVVAEAVIPSSAGGFTIREIGLFDDVGDLIAIGKYPATFKPKLDQGSVKDLYIRMVIESSNASSVTLKVDPAIILASRKYVDDKVASSVGTLGQDVANVKTNLTTHLAESTTGAHKAKNITLEDATGKFVATELEGAMSELFTNVSNGKTLVGTAITDVDNSLVVPTEPSFADLDTLIRSISTGKKWASGNTTDTKVFTQFILSDGNPTMALHKITVTGLDFTPSTIIIKGVGANIIANQTFLAPMDLHDNSGRAYRIIASGSYPGGEAGRYNAMGVKLQGNAVVNSSGFTLPVLYTSPTHGEYGWIAIE